MEGILAEAEQAGIISGDQRRAILARAAESGPRARLSATTWIASLAGLFVLAGISLLIATNWESIGPVVRIVAFLLLLLGVGEGAIRAHERGPVLATSLDLVWFVLPLLGIGLYAQTFQLSGDSITPLLVWLALGVPLAWLTSQAVVPAIHTASLTIVLLVGSFLAGGALFLPVAPGLGTWALSIATLSLVVVQYLRLLPQGQRYHCFGVLAAWSLGVLVSTPPFGLEHAAWVAVAAMALATLWMVGLLRAEAGPSELLVGATTWLGVVYAITFAWHTDGRLEGPTTSAGIAGTWVAVVAAAASVFALPATRFGSHPRSSQVGRALLLLPLALSLVLLIDTPEAIHAVALAANAVLVVLAMAILWHGSRERALDEINFGVLVLLVVLVTRFFDVFGSMVQSGLGFIVAGLFLAGLAFGLDRARRRLIGTAEGTDP